MNTVRSVWLGWGTLMVAGATAYYFAKKDINAHRREQELRGVRGTEFLECTICVISKLIQRVASCRPRRSCKADRRTEYGGRREDRRRENKEETEARG